MPYVGFKVYFIQLGEALTAPCAHLDASEARSVLVLCEDEDNAVLAD